MPVIFERRSVRRFLAKPVEQEKVERILRAGFEAPSARNRRPWEFLVLTRGEDLKAVAEMSPYAKMAAGAAAVIAPCVNLEHGESTLDDTWWVQDLAAATENILLQIVEEGLGGVWLGWYPDQGRIREFSSRFGLPGHIIPFSLVALGYPVGKPEPVNRFDPEKVYYGTYGKRQETGR